MSKRMQQGLQNFTLSLMFHLAVLVLLVWWLKTPLPATPKDIELDLSRSEEQTPPPPVAEARVDRQESGINYQRVNGGSPWLIPRMGDYASASQVAQKPMWVDGLFGYYTNMPKSAMPPKSYGDSHYVVMVEVYIDTEGKVQGSQVVMGGYEGLNEFIEEKVKNAHFEPALDAHGQPMLCKMSFPIDVELMNQRGSEGYRFKSK